MRTERVLWLSTGHLTWATCQKLEELPPELWPTEGGVTHYGFFLYASDEPSEAMPEDLKVCVAFARKNGLSYIRFDCDEALIGELPDHSETHR